MFMSCALSATTGDRVTAAKQFLAMAIVVVLSIIMFVSLSLEKEAQMTTFMLDIYSNIVAAVVVSAQLISELQ